MILLIKKFVGRPGNGILSDPEITSIPLATRTSTSSVGPLGGVVRVSGHTYLPDAGPLNMSLSGPRQYGNAVLSLRRRGG
jgi:hypothetical protein